MPIETVDFSSQALRSRACMNVAIPEGSGDKIPAVYFHHGTGDTFQTAASRVDMQSFADEANVAVIMPDAAESWYCNDPRTNERWQDHMVFEVVEEAEKKFPIIADRDSRIQTGFSMGGYGAMLLAMKFPDRFAAAISFAGSLLFGHETRPDRPARTEFMNAVAPPGGENDLFVIAKNLVDCDNRPVLHQEVGTSDHLLEYNRRFDKHLEELGIPHTYVESEGGHRWAWVETRMGELLTFVQKTVGKE
jgi:putative tributyrin esterase